MKETSAYWISFIRFAKWTTASYFGYIIQIVAMAKEVGVPPPMLHRSVFLLSKSEVPLKLKINFRPSKYIPNPEKISLGPFEKLF